MRFGGGARPSLLARRVSLPHEERQVLPVALFLEALYRNEPQRGRVHAVALAGRRRPVVEDVPEVRVGVRGADLGARREEPAVIPLAHVPELARYREARPARPGLLLVERAEDRLARDDVDVDAGPVVVPVLVLKGRLGTLVLRHLVLHGGERLRERRIVGLLEGHGIPSFPRHGLRLRRRRLVAPELLQARVAAAVPAIELVAHGILLVVALMVLLGRVERGRRHDLGRDRAAEALGETLLRLLRETALRVVVVEDRGSILVAVVAELRLRRERVDVVPEDVEQLRVADLARVVDDLDRFGVSGAARRHLLVGGVPGVAAGVADGGREDALQLLEGGLHAPEAPAGEGRRGALLRAGGRPAERGQRAHEEQARKSAASRLHRPAWMPRAPRRFLRPGHGAQRRDRLLHVPGRLELRVERVADDPLPVDHEGDAAREEAERRRHAVLPAHGAARVGEQDERQVVPGGELLVRRRGVGADADHLGAGVLEVLVLVAEGACFLRAAGRVVLRVEVEDDRLPAAVVAQPHRAAARVREREVGRRVANADAGGAAAEQVEQSHAGPDTIIARPGQPAPFSPRAACVTIRGHARARARAASCRPVSTARVSRPPARALIVPALAAAGFVPLAAWLRFGIDDAFINFRYAANLAAGLGPVFNPGERVEGYAAPARA